MVFVKGGGNGKKRLASEMVTPEPSNKRSEIDQTDIELAIFKTKLQQYMETNPHEVDSTLIEFMVEEIKKGMPYADGVLDSLEDKLKEMSYKRIQKARHLKANLEEIAATAVVSRTQDLELKSIDRMDAEELDKYVRFLELANAKAKFVQHTSKIIHPVYKQLEIIAEALNSMGDEELEDAFECREQLYAIVSSQASSPVRQRNSRASSNASAEQDDEEE